MIFFCESLNQVRIKCKAFFIPSALPWWLHTRPRNREAIRLHIEVSDVLHIFAEAVVVITSDIAAAGIHDLAGRVAESIPDRRRTATIGSTTFDLIGAGGHAQKERLGKLLG